MGRHKKLAKPKKSLADTHLRIVPFLDEKGRHLSLCSCAFHYGFVHPSAPKIVEHCGKGCDYFKQLYLEDIPFNKEELLRLLSEEQKHAPRKHYIPINPHQDPKKGRFYWVLDRGSHVYIAKPALVQNIERIEEDHFRLFVNTSERVH